MDPAAPSTTRIPIDPQDLRPSPDAVARYFGGADYHLDPKTRSRILAGIDQAMTMVNPLAGYRVVPFEAITSGVSSRWQGGPHPDIFLDQTGSSDRFLAVYLATIGKALEDSCRKMADRNKMYQALLTDAAGTAMLDILGMNVETAVAVQARRMGLFTGCRLGPGLNGVALDNQRLLFDLLGGDSFGVHLNDSFVMQPSKSISAFVVFHDSEQRYADGNKCSRCERQQCHFRVVDD